MGFDPSFYAEVERRYRKVHAIRYVFERVARILAGKPVRVEWTSAPDPNVPGFTNGETIYLNKTLVMDQVEVKEDGAFASFLLAAKGLILHELSHILFTPRANSYICSVIRNDDVARDGNATWRAFNALEDQRIETMFTIQYTPSTPYFMSAALEWLLHDPVGAFPLIYGRKYLPAEIRKASSELFKAAYPSIHDELCVVIDRYLVTTFPSPNGDTAALGLVRRYRDLLASQGLGPGPEQPMGGHPTDPGPGTPDEKPGAFQGTGEPDEAAQVAGAGAIAAQIEAEAKAEAEDAPDADGEGGTGAGGPAKVDRHEAPTAEGLKAEITEIKKEIDDSISGDLKKTAKTIEKIAEFGSGDMEVAVRQDAVRPGTSKLAKQIAEKLRRLQLDLEPDRETRQTSGRVNMRRAMSAQDHNVDVFDRWSEGAEAEGGVEVVVALDISGSMSGSMVKASEALWSIRRACQIVGIPVTTLAFESDWSIMSTSKQKAHRSKFDVYQARGGTSPYNALVHARLLLKQSRMANRLLVTITDGSWNPSGMHSGQVNDEGNLTGPDDVVESINKLPGGNSLIFSLGKSYGVHNHKHQCVGNVEAIPDAIGTLVKDILRNAASPT